MTAAIDLTSMSPGRIAAASSAFDRLWHAAEQHRGLRLTAAQVAALADAAAVDGSSQTSARRASGTPPPA